MRSIDHFVLVAADLSQVRASYQNMGFTVAAKGRHPFGTENANMYFPDGAMVETVAVGDKASYETAASQGNTFAANDAAFRRAWGDQGFSHLVASSTDAAADDRRFRRQGVSGGPVVSFSRPFENPDGSWDTISAHLAFATHPKSPSAFFFTCEDVRLPKVDRSSLQVHENGVIGVAGMVACAPVPSLFADFLQDLFQAPEITSSPEEVRATLANGKVSILSPRRIAAEFGVSQEVAAGLLHRGLIFQTADMERLQALLSGNGVAYESHNNRLVIPPTGIAGPFFAFEAA